MTRKKEIKEKHQQVARVHNNYLDVLKGLTIILVVLGHSIQMHINFDDNILFRVIYAFHMPLFMFLSGAVAAYSSKPMNLDFLKKKFIVLVIPFLAWIPLAYRLDYAYRTTTFLHYLKTIIKTPDVGLWFLPVLFMLFCSLAFILFLQRYIGTAGFILAGFLIYALPATRFGLGLVRWHLPFFLTGYFIFKYQKHLSWLRVPVMIFCLVTFPVLAAFWHRTTEPAFSGGVHGLLSRHTLDTIQVGDWLNFNFFQFLINFYKYLVGFSGIGFIYFAMQIPSKISFIRRFLSKTGQYTMDIYVLSNRLLFLGIGIYWVNIFSSTVLAVAASIFISVTVIRRIPILNQILLGGRTARPVSK